MAFLRDAFNASEGRFRNLRSAEGEWLDRGGSEDSHARAVLALGVAIADAPDRGLAREAARLFDEALPAARALTGLRPVAAVLLGCDAALRGGAEGAADTTFRSTAARLGSAFAGLPSDWPWPEPAVTYENAILPRALIVAGTRLDDKSMVATACRVLDWLATAQTNQSGALTLVGNERWWPRGDPPSHFDQQPIDATSLLLAAETAFAVTAQARYRHLAEIAYGWFLGDNEIGVPVATPATGGCHDGLTPGGVNLNQGAESTLMWLTALEHMRRLRAPGRPREHSLSGSTPSYRR
jgi:hypothetical protein